MRLRRRTRVPRRVDRGVLTCPTNSPCAPTGPTSTAFAAKPCAPPPTAQAAVNALVDERVVNHAADAVFDSGHTDRDMADALANYGITAADMRRIVCTALRSVGEA